MADPLNVQFLFASPVFVAPGVGKDPSGRSERLEVGREAQIVCKKASRKLFDLHAASLSALAIRSPPSRADILHISAHCKLSSDHTAILSCEDDSGGGVEMTAAEFKAALQSRARAGGGPPTLAILTCCHSQSLVPACMESDIRHVISICKDDPLPDSLALRLTELFYDRLLRVPGQSLEACFSAISSELQGELRRNGRGDAKVGDFVVLSSLPGADPADTVLLPAPTAGAPRARGLLRGPLPPVDNGADSGFLFFNTALVHPDSGVYHHLTRSGGGAHDVVVVTQTSQDPSTCHQARGSGKSTFVRQLARTVSQRAATNGFGAVVLLDDEVVDALATRLREMAHLSHGKRQAEAARWLRAVVDLAEAQRGGASGEDGRPGISFSVTTSARTHAAAASAATAPAAPPHGGAVLRLGGSEGVPLEARISKGARPAEAGARTLVCVLVNEAAFEGSHAAVPALVAAACKVAASDSTCRFVIESMVSPAGFCPDAEIEPVLTVQLPRPRNKLAAETLLKYVAQHREGFAGIDVGPAHTDWAHAAARPDQHPEDVAGLAGTACVQKANGVPGLLRRLAAELWRGKKLVRDEAELSGILDNRRTDSRRLFLRCAAQVRQARYMTDEEIETELASIADAPGVTPVRGYWLGSRYYGAGSRAPVQKGMDLPSLRKAVLAAVELKLRHGPEVDAGVLRRSLEACGSATVAAGGNTQGEWAVWDGEAMAREVDRLVGAFVGTPTGLLLPGETQSVVDSVALVAGKVIGAAIGVIREARGSGGAGRLLVHREVAKMWCDRVVRLAQTLHLLSATGEGRTSSGLGGSVFGLLTDAEAWDKLQRAPAASRGEATAVAHVSADLATLGKLMLTGVSGGSSFTLELTGAELHGREGVLVGAKEHGKAADSVAALAAELGVALVPVTAADHVEPVALAFVSSPSAAGAAVSRGRRGP